MTAVLVVTILATVGYAMVKIADITLHCLAVYATGDVQPSADDGGQLTRGIEALRVAITGALIVIAAFIGSGLRTTGPATATTGAVSSQPTRAAPARCPHSRKGVRFYRSRYVQHRAVRELATSWPAGRKPRNCADALYLAEVWPTRSLQARLATEQWLRDQRTLDEQTSWQAAIREAQAAYPGN